MKAVVFAGNGRVEVEEVPPPKLDSERDAIVRVHQASICGSDIHLLHGKTPGMRRGAVMGHEFVGTVTDRGDAAGTPEPGTRVVGSFMIVCGRCDHCAARRFNFCRSRRALGLGPLTGDLDGSQAEYVRVPDADVNLRRLDAGPNAPNDEQALFAGDVLSTGIYAAGLAGIERGTTVAVVGGGPIGFFSALAARRHHPAAIVVLDADAARVEFARRAGLQACDVSQTDAAAVVADATGGALADVAIEAVGHVDALRSAMRCVRDGGRVVVVGVYGAERYEMPTGVVWIRGLDLRFSGMANIHACWDDALSAVAAGEIDPTCAVTHRLPLDEAAEGYRLFERREAMKVALIP